MESNFWYMALNAISSYGGPTYGTRYDLSKACSRCGSGANREGSLILSGLKAPKRPVFANLFLDILIADSFVDELKKSGINTFSDVVYKASGKKMPFKVLDSEYTLPPFSRNTTGFIIDEKRRCKQCKREGHFNDPEHPVSIQYEGVSNELLSKDVLTTYELFGFSVLRSPFEESVFAQPLYIISDKMKSVMELNKADKCMAFFPVSLSGI